MKVKLDHRTLDEQLEQCDGKGCKCAAYGKCECACDADWTPAEVYTLRAQLRYVQRELAAYKRAKSLILCGDAVHSTHYPIIVATLNGLEGRVSELLAQEGVPAQPQYREPTLEDAMELLEIPWAMRASQILPVLKQLGFVRKVQP